jgi:hypothetical protein
MELVITLTRAQLADVRRQLGAVELTAKPTAKRPMTEHRRVYQRDLMRVRRAAAKAA